MRLLLQGAAAGSSSALEGRLAVDFFGNLPGLFDLSLGPFQISHTAPSAPPIPPPTAWNTSTSARICIASISVTICPGKQFHSRQGGLRGE